LTGEPSKIRLDDGGLIDADLKGMIFSPLGAAGILISPAGSERDGGHLSGMVPVGPQLIGGMPRRLRHR